MVAWESTNTSQMDKQPTEARNKDGELSAWGRHIFVSAIAAVPIAGLVVVAALLIVYVMRVLAISAHRAREFLLIAGYAAVFFPTGLLDLESLNPLFWETRIGCFVLTLIFLRAMHSWTPVRSTLTLPSLSKDFWRRRKG